MLEDSGEAVDTEELVTFWKKVETQNSVEMDLLNVQLVTSFRIIGRIVEDKRDFELADILPEVRRRFLLFLSHLFQMKKMVLLYGALSDSAREENRRTEADKTLESALGRRGSFASVIRALE